MARTPSRTNGNENSKIPGEKDPDPIKHRKIARKSHEVVTRFPVRGPPMRASRRLQRRPMSKRLIYIKKRPFIPRIQLPPVISRKSAPCKTLSRSIEKHNRRLTIQPRKVQFSERLKCFIAQPYSLKVRQGSLLHEKNHYLSYDLIIRENPGNSDYGEHWSDFKHGYGFLEKVENKRLSLEDGSFLFATFVPIWSNEQRQPVCFNFDLLKRKVGSDALDGSGILHYDFANIDKKGREPYQIESDLQIDADEIHDETYEIKNQRVGLPHDTIVLRQKVQRRLPPTEKLCNYVNRLSLPANLTQQHISKLYRLGAIKGYHPKTINLINTWFTYRFKSGINPYKSGGFAQLLENQEKNLFKKIKDELQLTQIYDEDMIIEFLVQMYFFRFADSQTMKKVTTYIQANIELDPWDFMLGMLWNHKICRNDFEFGHLSQLLQRIVFSDEDEYEKIKQKTVVEWMNSVRLILFGLDYGKSIITELTKNYVDQKLQPFVEAVNFKQSMQNEIDSVSIYSESK